MPIIAQYLFGSYARRDDTESSDFDVLSITDEKGFRTVQHNIMNISFYPKDKFLQGSRQGDLFVMHILYEGVRLYDSLYFDQEFRESFKHRDSYDLEVGKASDLGWFLVRHLLASLTLLYLMKELLGAYGQF